MSDRTCITMPSDLYQFILATPCVQDYSVQLAVGAATKEPSMIRVQRDKDYQITFRMDEKFKFFEPCLRVVKDNVPVYDYSGWRERGRREFDCFIDFDFERAKRIATKANFHITMALNVLIGVGADKLPIWKMLKLYQQPECAVLILPWDDGVESEKFHEYMMNNHP